MTRYRCKHAVEAMRWDGESWLVWSSGEFLVMDDEQFRETYEEVI
jgi:hypothetical protein